MPLRQPCATDAHPDLSSELEGYRRILAGRLAWYWSHDPPDEIADEMRAWLDEACDQRAAYLAVARRHAQRQRAARARTQRRKLRDLDESKRDPTDVREASQWLEAFHLRLNERGAWAQMHWALSVVRGFSDSDQPEIQELAARARSLLASIVKHCRYEDTAEIAFALGEGKANAPQSIAAMALAEMGWTTARIAAALPTPERIVGDGCVSAAKDKAQVRRMTRVVRRSR